jgi:hypothetical protein
MRILVANGVQVGEPLALAMVQAAATSAGVDGAEQSAALALAGMLGWIESGPQDGTIALTSAGSDA